MLPKPTSSLGDEHILSIPQPIQLKFKISIGSIPYKLSMHKDASDLLGNLFLCHIISKYWTRMSACLRCGVQWQTTEYNTLRHSYKRIYRCQNLWQCDVDYPCLHNSFFQLFLETFVQPQGFSESNVFTLLLPHGLPSAAKLIQFSNLFGALSSTGYLRYLMARTMFHQLRLIFFFFFQDGIAVVECMLKRA